ncbi:MAG TPA: hypothetical protein VK003_12375 [Oceanobacillus sp.]|nr:hypothetical protein [Oceanobacillus sp.]
MTHYQLSDKQKQLLRALVPGLKSGAIGTNWTVALGARNTAIFDDRHINFRSLGWHLAERADFDQFVSQGFFRVAKSNTFGIPSHYALNNALIIEAVENDFLMPDTASAR